MTRIRQLGLTALLVAAATAVGTSQIKRLTLPEMVGETDNAVVGEIVGKRVFRVDHPIDGAELYFTTLTIEGRSMLDDSLVTVDVTYTGGFLNEEEGVYNSEAPSDDDTRIGNQVVVFYRWSNDIGGNVHANALHAAHGGLYRTVVGPDGPVVLGRGEGYALAKNLKVQSLDSAIKRIRADQKER
jgi:hypothetical protein